MGLTRTIIASTTSPVRIDIDQESLELTKSSYNSVFFGSISSNDYMVFSISESFIDDPGCIDCVNSWIVSQNLDTPSLLKGLRSKAHAGVLERLDPARCINEYAMSIQSKRQNLLLVAHDDVFPPPKDNYFINGSRVYWGAEFYASSATDPSNSVNSYDWICSGLHNNSDTNGDFKVPFHPGLVQNAGTRCSKDVKSIKAANPDSWRVGVYCDRNGTCDFANWPVEYCLSELAEPHCKIYLEPNIVTIVTILNLSKPSCIPVACPHSLLQQKCTCLRQPW
jgi:hypothetical protein